MVINSLFALCKSVYISYFIGKKARVNIEYLFNFVIELIQ